MRKPLLERFDNWLDNLSAFTDKHLTFSTTVVTITVVTLVGLFLYTLSVMSDSGEAAAQQVIAEMTT